MTTPPRTRRWVGAVFFLGLLTGMVAAGVAAVRGADDEDEGVTPERRAALYAEIERDVADLERHGNVLKRVVRLVSPTVVHIVAEKEDTATPRSRRDRNVEEAGSGVVFEHDSKFFVLTNRHVIRGAEDRLSSIRVGLASGREVNPTKVWMDKRTDVAVMAVPAKGLVAAKLGDSATIEIGDFVLAVGSPFGLSHSVTYGIISAKGRRELVLGDDVELQDFLQTDAAINPGNSGGPLLNLRGEVIGVNTAIATNHGGNEGVGFSIPINMAIHVAKGMIDHGTAPYAYLGVTLDRKFDADSAQKIGLSRPRGARIVGLTPGAPAEAAKLKVGDVILEFNKLRVQDDTHLVNLVKLTDVGTVVPLVIYRDGKTLEMSVKVGDLSKFEP